MKITGNAIRQGFDGFGFCQPGGAFHQQVTICQNGNNQPVYQVGLTDNLGIEIIAELQNFLLMSHADAYFLL